VLDEAVRAFYAVLDRYTLADVARNQRELAGILFADAPRPSSHSRRAS
jgi:Rrf2 family nitric oxide-sensitive transcriptional repressor